MKKTIILLQLLLAFFTTALASENSKCVLNDKGKLISFLKIDGDPTDDDLHSIEKLKILDFIFLLKVGHGIYRVEAYKGKKFHSSTFMQSGVPNQAFLTLKVIGKDGRDLEFFCDDFELN